MAYFILKNASETVETGPVYPQIQKLKPGYDKKKDTSIYSFLKKSQTNKLLDDIPDLDSFIMHSRAKPTDFISNAITNNYGFFVTAKLKEIFEKHFLPLHYFYPAKVIHKSRVLENYFWMYVISDMTDFIDYANSTFFIYKRYKSSEEYITISSKSDFLTKERSLKVEYPHVYTAIHAEKISLKLPTNKRFDLFQIGEFDFDFYISDSLRNALVKNDITGCNIEPTDRIII